ncbi:MAG: hypothetical protein ACR2NL_03780 [Acidimicrobiia bacterium]
MARTRQRESSRRLLLFAVALAMIGAAYSAGDRAIESTDAPLDLNAGSYQEELLVDGVTFAEYERAVLDTMSCIESKGMEVLGPYPEGGGLALSFDYGGWPDGTPTEELVRADFQFSECAGEFLTDVEDAYYESLQP